MRPPLRARFARDRRLIVAIAFALLMGAGIGVGASWIWSRMAARSEADQMALLVQYGTVAAKAEYWEAAKLQVTFEGDALRKLSEAIGSLKPAPGAPAAPSSSAQALRLLSADGWFSFIG